MLYKAEYLRGFTFAALDVANLIRRFGPNLARKCVKKEFENLHRSNRVGSPWGQGARDGYLSSDTWF